MNIVLILVFCSDKVYLLVFYSNLYQCHHPLSAAWLCTADHHMLVEHLETSQLDYLLKLEAHHKQTGRML